MLYWHYHKITVTVQSQPPPKNVLLCIITSNKSKRKDEETPMKILIIEDDLLLGDTLCELLRSHDNETEFISNGTDGLDYALSGYYDIILLDVMLPGKNGFEIVSELRKEKISTPVLMLTAKDEWSDKVAGLDAGADDYLTKPFIPEELFARIRALTRRKGEVIMNRLEYKSLALNLSLSQLEYGSKSIRLPSKEAAIMKILLTNQGQIVPKETLIVQAWSSDSDVEDNNVEVYISFLRKKLQFLHSDVKINTARKIGYFLS